MGVIQNSINQTLGSLAVFSRLNPKTEEQIFNKAFNKQVQRYANAYKGNPGALDQPTIDVTKPSEGPAVHQDWSTDVQQTGLGNARAEAQREIKTQQLQRIKGWRDAGKARRQIEKIEKLEKRGKL